MLDLILFLNSLGGGEILIILVVVLLFFGSSKVPELARGLGKGIREFKEAADGVKREIEKGANEVKEDINIQKEIDNFKDKPLDQQH